MTFARRLPTLLVLLVALTWLLPSQVALAHASLVRSVPADGASVEEAPGEVFLWFDEAVRLGFSQFDVRDPAGRAVKVRSVLASSSPGLVTLELPPLEHGVYTVNWAVLSEIDTHVTEGILLFGVGEPVSSGAVAARAATPIQPVEVGLRWLDLLLLAGLIGALVVVRLVLEIRPEPGEAALALLRSAARRRVLGLAVTCGVLSLAIGVGLFLWQAQRVADLLGGGPTWFDVAPRLLFDGRWARLWWLRQVLVAALTGLSWFVWRTASRTETTEHVPGPPGQDRFPAWAWYCVGALAVALAVVVASSGHAATVGRAPLAVAADALHLLGASAWVGGLFGLAVGLLPLHRRRGDLIALVRGSWRPFGRIAALSLGVLAATGLYSAGQQVASVDALVLTPYGKALMAKVGIVAVAATIGALNAVLLRPSLAAPFARLLRRPDGWTPVSSRHFHRLAVAEVALGVVVFGAVGVITSTAPARGPEFRPATNIPSSLSEQVDDLLLTVTVKPNLPGTNVVLVDAVSTRRPPPAEVASVVFSVEEASGQNLSIPLEVAGPDAFQASVSDLDRSGPWDLSIDVQRPGLPDTTASFEWNVRDGTTVRSQVISDRPLGPMLTTAAVAVGLIVLGTGVGMWFRRRPPRPGRTSAPARHGASAATTQEASLSHGGVRS